MNDDEIVIGNGIERLSVLKDPFSKPCVASIHMHYFRGNRFVKSTFKATVQFENGATKGEQDFQSRNFSELIGQVDAFLKTLPL